MAEIISDGRLVHQVAYHRFFASVDEPTRGYRFPCDSNGMLNLTENEALLLAGGATPLEAALNTAANLDKFEALPANPLFTDEGVRVERWSYYESAVIRCNCGYEFGLHNAWLNTCPRCQQDYSGNGQMLAPRYLWGEETGEHWSDAVNAGAGLQLAFGP